MYERRRLPTDRKAITHKATIHSTSKTIACPHCGDVISLEPSQINLYITVGLYDDGAPGEIFIKLAKHGDTVKGLVGQWGVMVSIALQAGVPLTVICEKGTFTRFEPAGMTENPDIRMAHSIIDYVCRWLHKTFLL